MTAQLYPSEALEVMLKGSGLEASCTSKALVG